MGSGPSLLVSQLKTIIKDERKHKTSYFDILAIITSKRIVGITMDEHKEDMGSISFFCCAVTIAVPYKGRIKMITKRGYGYDRDELAEKICKKVAKRILVL